VSELSLDHDLGDDLHGTGYDVLLWVEEAVVLSGFQPPRITIHSANPAARQRMKAALVPIAARLNTWLCIEAAPEGLIPSSALSRSRLHPPPRLLAPR
jgi:hypothetical protein